MGSIDHLDQLLAVAADLGLRARRRCPRSRPAGRGRGAAACVPARRRTGSTTSTGNRLRLTSWTVGSSASSGRSGLARSTFVAHVGEAPVGVEAGIELQHDVGAALIGGRAHLLDALDVAQLLLHRPDQQALGVFRRDALVDDVDVDDRDVDVRLGLLGHRRDRRSCRRSGSGPGSASTVRERPRAASIRSFMTGRPACAPSLRWRTGRGSASSTVLTLWPLGRSPGRR